MRSRSRIVHIWFLLTVLVMVLLAQAPRADAALPSLGQWQADVVKVYAPEVRKPWRVNRAIREWNEAGVIELRRIYRPCREVEPCINIEVTNEADVDFEWNGLAYVYRTEQQQIIHCDIKLNPDYSNVRGWGTTSHEIGHCLGMPHHDGPRSVMNIERRLWVKAPSPWDRIRLERTYPHTRATHYRTHRTPARTDVQVIP